MWNNLDCFAKFFRISEHGEWAIMELCKPFDEETAIRSLGIEDLDMDALPFTQAITWWAAWWRGLDCFSNAVESIDEYINAGRGGEGWKRFISSFKSFLTNAKPNLWILDEFQNEDNWGMAIRNGKPSPVIIDYGYNEKVGKRYY